MVCIDDGLFGVGMIVLTAIILIFFYVLPMRKEIDRIAYGDEPTKEEMREWWKAYKKNVHEKLR